MRARAAAAEQQSVGADAAGFLIRVAKRSHPSGFLAGWAADATASLAAEVEGTTTAASSPTAPP
jgi:hypothetical protein